MPKVHNVGKQYFVQILDFPVKWGSKVAVKGWTQEIEEPFRTATPVIVRLPFYKAVAFGKWNGQLDEEQALSAATGMRVLADEDFQEGWTAPAYQATEEDIWDWDL